MLDVGIGGVLARATVPADPDGYAELVAQAYGADGDAEFNRAVGWADILAFVVGGIGVSLVAFDRFSAARQAPPPQMLQEVADRSAQLVLVGEGEQRARLLGTDRGDTRAINVGFYRNMVRYRAAGGDERGRLDTALGYYASLNPGRSPTSRQSGSGTVSPCAPCAVEA